MDSYLFSVTDKTCETIVDVAFLVDSSGSISRREWKLLLDFVKSVVNKLNVSSSGSHVALISYASHAVVELRFNTLTGDKLNPVEINKMVDRIRHHKGSTYMDRALQLADKEIFSERGGMRKAVRKVWKHPLLPIMMLVQSGFEEDLSP